MSRPFFDRNKLYGEPGLERSWAHVAQQARNELRPGQMGRLFSLGMAEAIVAADNALRDHAAEGALTPVYDVLVRLCEAPDGKSERLQWAHFWNDTDGSEYRFCGNLGFGGKFWRNNGAWYVNCYQEDETPIRKLVIAETNRALEVLHRHARDAE